MTPQTIHRPTPESIHAMLAKEPKCQKAACMVAQQIRHYSMVQKKREPLRIYGIREIQS